MDLTQEMADEFAGYLKDMKEREFLEDPENCDLAPNIIAVDSEGTPFVHFSMVGVEREEMPQMYACAAGAAESYVMHVGEAYMVNSKKEMPNGPQNLEKRFEDGEEGVYECVIAHGMDRSGNVVHITMPFKKESGALVWIEDERHVDFIPKSADSQMGGFIPDTLAWAMSLPQPRAEMERMYGSLFSDMPDREKEVHCAIVMARFALEAGKSVAFAFRSEEEQQMVKESIERLGNENWSLIELTR